MPPERSRRLSKGAAQSFRDAAMLLLVVLAISSVRISGTPGEAAPIGLHAAELPAAVLSEVAEQAVQADQVEPEAQAHVLRAVEREAQPKHRSCPLQVKRVEQIDPAVELEAAELIDRVPGKVSFRFRSGDETRLFEFDFDADDLRQARRALGRVLKVELETAMRAAKTTPVPLQLRVSADRSRVDCS